MSEIKIYNEEGKELVPKDGHRFFDGQKKFIFYENQWHEIDQFMDVKKEIFLIKKRLEKLESLIRGEKK